MRKTLYTRSDRRALCVLFLVILAIVGVTWFVKSRKQQAEPQQATATQDKEMLAFEEELKADSAAWAKQHPHWEKGERIVETFAFDPNTADSATFIRLGLAPWQAHNALKYRSKGGRWRSPDDFRRLYGLSESDFHRLRPYIHIAADPRQTEWDRQKEQWAAEKQQREAERNARQAHYDSIRATYPQKYAEGTTIELSTADTTALKGIPGIGSVYARMICQYRERLGGFVSKDQLREIPNLPPGIEKWFTLAPNAPIHKIKINKATFKELVHHPYLNYEQTKDIVNYIRMYGALRSWKDLQLSKNFSEKDFKRLAPYFSF